MLKKEKNKSGFSLIELLIVVSILGILLLVTIRYVRNFSINEKEVLKNIIFTLSHEASKSKKEIIVYAKKGMVLSSNGKIFKLSSVKSGKCIVKKSGILLNCCFFLEDGKLCISNLY